MQALSVFSDPIIRAVDAVVGAKNCMRVDAVGTDGTPLTLRVTHHDLEQAVSFDFPDARPITHMRAFNQMRSLGRKRVRVAAVRCPYLRARVTCQLLYWSIIRLHSQSQTPKLLLSQT